MNYYPHHIGDFDKATRHLTRIERSIYRDLIEMYYDTEQQLPLELSIICRKILARTNEEVTLVEQTLNEFFVKTDLGWYHKRCSEEIELYCRNNSQKALAGKASAEAKRLKNEQNVNARSTAVERLLNGCSTSVCNQNQNQNQEPVTKNQEPKSIKEPDQKQGATRPDWLNEDDWESFKKHRGAKFTVRAQEMMVKQLSTYRDQGQDPNAMLVRSIANGWKGVFPEKQGVNNGTGYISERDKARKRVAKELCGYDSDAIAGVSQRID